MLSSHHKINFALHGFSMNFEELELYIYTRCPESIKVTHVQITDPGVIISIMNIKSFELWTVHEKMAPVRSVAVHGQPDVHCT